MAEGMHMAEGYAHGREWCASCLRAVSIFLAPAACLESPRLILPPPCHFERSEKSEPLMIRKRLSVNALPGWA